MKVHRYFGLGFPEIIYQRSLMMEFETMGLRYRTEVEKDIYYNGAFVGKEDWISLLKKKS